MYSTVSPSSPVSTGRICQYAVAAKTKSVDIPSCAKNRPSFSLSSSAFGLLIVASLSSPSSPSSSSASSSSTGAPKALTGLEDPDKLLLPGAAKEESFEPPPNPLPLPPPNAEFPPRLPKPDPEPNAVPVFAPNAEVAPRVPPKVDVGAFFKVSSTLSSGAGEGLAKLDRPPVLPNDPKPEDDEPERAPKADDLKALSEGCACVEMDLEPESVENGDAAEVLENPFEAG